MGNEPRISKVKFFRKVIYEYSSNIFVPWRYEECFKKVLLGELLMIRTSYRQAVRVYNEYLKLFPDVFIPEGKENLAFGILKQVGLKHRVRGIIKVLKQLENKKNLILDAESLKRLPYVSEYVASAVLFFLGKADFIYPDANIIRLIGRYFGILGRDKTHPSEKQNKLIKILISSFERKEEKRRFVVNLLDYAIEVCKVRPLCSKCELLKYCCLNYRMEKENDCRKKCRSD